MVLVLVSVHALVLVLVAMMELVLVWVLELVLVLVSVLVAACVLAALPLTTYAVKKTKMSRPVYTWDKKMKMTLPLYRFPIAYGLVQAAVVMMAGCLLTMVATAVEKIVEMGHPLKQKSRASALLTAMLLALVSPLVPLLMPLLMSMTVPRP